MRLGVLFWASITASASAQTFDNTYAEAKARKFASLLGISLEGKASFHAMGGNYIGVSIGSKTFGVRHPSLPMFSFIDVNAYTSGGQVRSTESTQRKVNLASIAKALLDRRGMGHFVAAGSSLVGAPGSVTGLAKVREFKFRKVVGGLTCPGGDYVGIVLTPDGRLAEYSETIGVLYEPKRDSISMATAKRLCQKELGSVPSRTQPTYLLDRSSKPFTARYAIRIEAGKDFLIVRASDGKVFQKYQRKH
jgi:hypothetical protein